MGDNLPIGRALRLLRRDLDLSQVDASRRTGIDFRYLSNWETGRVVPALRSVCSYLVGLGLDFSNLQDALDRITDHPPPTAARFERIDHRLDAMAASLAELSARLSELEASE